VKAMYLKNFYEKIGDSLMHWVLGLLETREEPTQLFLLRSTNSIDLNDAETNFSTSSGNKV
jgi:hypothetical protein